MGPLRLSAFLIKNIFVLLKYLAMLHALFGKDLNLANDQGDTLAHLLAELGDSHAEVLSSLLEIRIQTQAGPKPILDLSAKNRRDETPVDVAKRFSGTGSGHQKIVSIFSGKARNRIG